MEFVIELPIGGESARPYLRCLRKYSEFTSLRVWCQVTILELNPVLITGHALNCVFKGGREGERGGERGRKNKKKKHRRMY